MCKTNYVIREDARAERIHLTKTKDLNHCQEKIMKAIGLEHVEKCHDCEAVRAFSSCFIISLIEVFMLAV